jgi:hypothetical protein
MTARARARTGHESGERGAIAVIVAVCLVMLFGMAAFAIDTGNLWQNRRHLITATDAAALAAAETYALGDDGCAGIDDIFVAQNDDAASVTSCVPVTGGAGSGYVTVNATKPVHFAIAGAIGISDRNITSSTSARYGIPRSIKRLRPLGLCDLNPAYRAWLSADPKKISAPVAITYANPQDRCPGASGNWSIMNFAGSGNVGDSTIQDWLRSGYSGYVDSNVWVSGNSGAFSNALKTELDALKDSGTPFELPVFNEVKGTGTNSSFFVTAFVSVVLTDFTTTGPQDERSLTVRFVSRITQGRCCSPGPDTGQRVVSICAVDPYFNPARCIDR